MLLNEILSYHREQGILHLVTRDFYVSNSDPADIYNDDCVNQSRIPETYLLI